MMRCAKNVMRNLGVALMSFLIFAVMAMPVNATLRIDSTGSTESTSGTTVTLAHTIGTEGNEVLVVCTQGALSATGVTWNGDAMSKVQEADSGSNFSTIWFLGTPDTGTHNVVVTKTNGVQYGVGAISFFDAGETVGGSGTTAGTGTTPSITVTVSGDAGIAVDCIWTGDPVPTVGSGQTKFFGIIALGDRKTGGSYETHSGSNVTMSWTMSSDAYALTALEVIEDIASSGSNGVTLMMGMVF